MSINIRREWSPEIPDSVGLWEFQCAETNHCSEAVAITSCASAGVFITFMVHDDTLGVQPLKHFHDGLTRIQWRKIA